MHSQPLSEIGNSCLCAGICWDLCQRGICIHRAYVQDSAALTANHILGKNLCRQQSADEIQIKNKFDIIICNIKECFCFIIKITELKIFLVGIGACIVTACAVDQNIAFAIDFQNIFMRGEYTCLIGYIYLDGCCFSACAANLLSQCDSRFNRTVQNCDLCSAQRQCTYKFTAQNTGTTGDNCNFACQIRFHREIHISSMPSFQNIA